MFDIKFASAVLLPMAESAYLSTLQPSDIPDGYSVLGRIGDGWGWIFQKDEVVIASFRGTVSFQDWMSDLDAVMEPYRFAKFGLVHSGMQKVYAEFRDSFINEIKSIKGMTRLIVTGHSLGAALAVCATPDIRYNAVTYLDPEVQNFAGPRFGNTDFMTNFNTCFRCTRVVNAFDIVPRVPVIPFTHVGTEIEIHGGVTFDAEVAHNLKLSYLPGLLKL
jgi:triacylglycerol lipase